MLGQTFSANTQIFISCFLEDIDGIRKLKKNEIDGSLCFSGARPFISMIFLFLGFPIPKKYKSKKIAENGTY